MKNQYFGDNRDLFTYDLIQQIMQAGLVGHFSFIPMLTADDSSNHGAKHQRNKAKVGTENKELMSFLDSCVAEGKKDIKQLQSLFGQQGIKMTIYEKPFSHEDRKEYFAQIGQELLSDSLVFADPDVGLEVKHPTEKHILYSEVKDLYQRMDENSILMLFQYLPHRPRQEYLNTRMEELNEKITSDWPVCIDDNEIAFFFLTKNPPLDEELTHLIGHYAEDYS